MAVKFNEKLLLWTLGVIQPTPAGALRDFLRDVFPEIDSIPTLENIEDYLKKWAAVGVASIVSKKPRYLYSLTYEGTLRLPKKLRHNRDKTRLFLLKKARLGRIYLSEEDVKGLVGDAPTAEDSRRTQDKQRPIGSAVASIGRAYWPLLSRQLFAGPITRTKTSSASSDIFLEFYSFSSFENLLPVSKPSLHIKNPMLYFLALAIGISPKLINSFIYAKYKHYRSFEIGKRGGGKRVISSPRIFLKTTQYWILDYLLYILKVHPSCQSYQKGKSIISNASPHSGKRFVANVDIEDFFGSINEGGVRGLLIKNSITCDLATLVAKIITLKDGLPQGAPTSPVVSNAYLYDFDSRALEYSMKHKLTYTRYADDITISGDNIKDVRKCLDEIQRLLRIFGGLRLNQSKTRIANRGGQQKVTGVVVNVEAAPPRCFRRRIRAMFHNANLNSKQHESRLNVLKGYISYLNSFPYLVRKKETERYSHVISELTARKNRDVSDGHA